MQGRGVCFFSGSVGFSISLTIGFFRFPPMPTFSEEDADADAEILMKQAIGFTIDSLTDFGDEPMHSCISDHLRSLRLLHFAQEATAAEMRALTDIAVNLKLGAPQEQAAVADPATVSSLEDVRKWFAENRPIRIPAALLIGSNDITSEGTTMTSALNKQLVKDIARDQVLVNGNLLIGAALGLEGVLDKMTSICEKLLEECHLPPLSKEVSPPCPRSPACALPPSAISACPALAAAAAAAPSCAPTHPYPHPHPRTNPASLR